MVTTLAPLLAAATTGEQLLNALFDDTFAGLHQLALFDWALLIPYYLVLAILSLYGLHRYFVIREYYRGKHKLNLPPAQTYTQESLPPVTIQLPLYNEEFVVERLIESTLEIRYPKHLLQVQVLDDSTDDSQPRNAALCARFRARGHDIEYVHRTNRVGYKAGALEHGLQTAKGEFVAVFDADFLPPADFLEKTIHYFTDPGIGVVQTRWSHINKDSNLLTEVQAMLLDAHFVLEHAARFTNGLFFNFNGTAGILRKAMIADAGGWQHDTLTEDTDLSYRAQLKGWRFIYLPSVACPSELPVETHAFQIQQQRWSKGLTQCARKLWRLLRRADVPRAVKVEAFFHLTPNISYPLMIIVSALMMPAMIIRFYQGPLEMMLIDVPLIVANFLSIGAFYLVAQRELYPDSWKRTIAFVPALMAVGVMLTLSNTKSVMEALFGVQTSFVRTPKYAVAQGQTRVKQHKYKRRSGWLPFLELATGTFFLAMAAWAVDSVNYLSVPFILLFVAGYYWAGFSTLWQEWQGKLRFERAQQRAVATAETGR